ncbi:MAG: pyridoxamine kinase [Firmicutes bacterium]|nr:pyridoxamine kinase [Bacillota bacterium]
MTKKICCVNDMPGVGKVALAAMLPILSAKGINVSCLPTALVSNTLDFGKFDILDTSDYMERTIEIWHQLGFRFDCIATGFMVNPRQIAIVEKLIEQQPVEDMLVFVDPIMGDEGKLYNGMSNENVAIMRQLSGYADVLIPNYTEACLLTGTPYAGNMTEAQAEELLGRCRGLGAKSVVITSAVVDGANCVIGYDARQKAGFRIGFELIDVRFPGTGDIFSAVLIADVLNGETLQDATAHAMKAVRDIIADNSHKAEKFYGVDIEKFISEGKL